MLWNYYSYATFSLSYENYQQWKKESCKGIGSWTELRYCAESMINSTLLTLQLLNSLSTIHLNWYFLRMTQPWMLYSQMKILIFHLAGFDCFWTGKGRLVMSFGHLVANLWLNVGVGGWLCLIVGVFGCLWLFSGCF